MEPGRTPAPHGADGTLADVPLAPACPTVASSHRTRRGSGRASAIPDRLNTGDRGGSGIFAPAGFGSEVARRRSEIL